MPRAALPWEVGGVWMKLMSGFVFTILPQSLLYSEVRSLQGDCIMGAIADLL